MKVQFIPVLELGYYNQNIPKPKLSKDMRFGEEWNQYRINCLKQAGCPEDWGPSFKGTDFYRLSDIPQKNFEWFISEHIEDYLKGEMEIGDLCPFFGGYALLQKSEILLYPQCCGDLSDIIYWKYICKHKESRYYNGHPAPEITFSDNNVCFHCVDEYDPFEPKTKSYFEVDYSTLLDAYNDVLPKLASFHDRVEKTLSNMKLPVSSERMARILIYENIELSDNKV